MLDPAVDASSCQPLGQVISYPVRIGSPIRTRNFAPLVNLVRGNRESESLCFPRARGPRIGNDGHSRQDRAQRRPRREVTAHAMDAAARRG
jgi:hypothetical protein